MGGFSAAARSGGVCSTSYATAESGRALQARPPRRLHQRRLAAAVVAAGAAAAAVVPRSAHAQGPLAPQQLGWLPAPAQQQQQQQQPEQRQRPGRQHGPVSCRSFGGNLGENLRKLTGGSKPPANVSQDGDDAGEAQQPSVWSDWQAELSDQDWEEWEGVNIADLDDISEVAELREQVIERRRLRAGKRRNVRDEYIRPIVDAQGIVNRLAVDEAEVEERVFVEAITNQYESREAVKYAGTLFAIPLVVGFILSRAVAQPVWSYAETLNPEAFAASDHQKVEGAHELHVEELRLRLAASLGQSPPLTDEQIHEHLHHTAVHLNDEFKEANKKALLNVVSDMTSASVFFIMLARQLPQRQILFRTIGRVFTGLSDTAKAFLIILITDILLGYHSEEGWTATLRLFSGHYGLEAEDEALKIFVATVPVFFDSLFKVWIFIGLNKEDPAAAVTLKQMDRH
ncbi:Chloroplast envelope membrane [Micractinium conductrix]|uniref:Chloroplast envelope membrane n=1 Tax=Micractinium conductrix TaxID=554055 RepID=A0A2P6V501_9CHLO|nr:Chloroplast envelope membrane [Micractinium conductrix]|eukprot:PSC69171.1 Chloroplast envelope membrane [Micractinium conductrix]